MPQVVLQERFSERIEGQIVDVPAPCVEQNADVPAPAPAPAPARGTQAPQLSRWTLRSEGFSHFSPDEKSAKTSANLLSHSMPSTRAACEIEHLQYGELWWGRQWDPDSWWLVDPKDGARVSPIIWRPPWELDLGRIEFAGLDSIRRIWFRGSRAALPLHARAERVRIWTLIRRVLWVSHVHSIASKNSRIQECPIFIRFSAACSEVEQDSLWPSMARSFYCVLSRAPVGGAQCPLPSIS